MKLLHLGCHSVLEYDELKLFHEMGIDVLGLGGYIDPKNPIGMRPPIPTLEYNKETVQMFHDICGKHPGIDGRELLTKELIDKFDVIMVMHLPKWIAVNWDIMKHKIVIWRTIGQSIWHTELTLKPYREAGMKIVRYSPMERNIPGFIGEDALIRFYKDPEVYKDWTGEDEQVTTFCQALPERKDACNYEVYKEVTAGFPAKIYGPRNEAMGEACGGELSYEDMNEVLRKSRAYLYIGTHPASYTLNFIEAWMSGCAMVAIGPEYGNSKHFPDHNLYEINSLMVNGEEGYCFNEISEMRFYINELLHNKELAQRISENGRKKAIEVFGRENIMKQWKTYFENL